MASLLTIELPDLAQQGSAKDEQRSDLPDLTNSIQQG